jgi:glucokinase
MAETTLLADIGGTHARFTILRGATWDPPTWLEVRDYKTAIDAIRTFLDKQKGDRPAQAVIDAAGPPHGGRIVMTNINWTVDEAEITKEFGFQSVTVVNDFAAQAWALPALEAGGRRQVGGGTAVEGAPQAVFGAGTGFGMAIRAPYSGGETVIITEAGHATLAPDTDEEAAILHALRATKGHVSVEDLLSGPGLVELYRQITALRATGAPERDAADIVKQGLAGTCETSRATLGQFCGWLGSAAGNIAFTTGARGGIYISGGVIAHFADFFAASSFRERFEAKGRMSPFVKAIPTILVTHDDPAFLGLARYVREVK